MKYLMFFSNKSAVVKTPGFAFVKMLQTAPVNLKKFLFGIKFHHNFFLASIVSSFESRSF